MAAFLARYLFASHAAMPIDVPDAFPDDDASVHESHINVLAAMGVIGGRTDGTFAPSAEVPRGQMATFLAPTIPPAPPTPLAANADHFAAATADVPQPTTTPHPQPTRKH